MNLHGTTASARPMAVQAPLFTTTDGRVDWVDVAKGVCILFVVMMHSTLGVQELTGETSWMGTLVTWAHPFRMPDFFFIAGLFLMRTIDAPWQRYLDRKVVHFAYFYVLWMVIQIAIKHGALTGDPLGSVHLMVQALYQPFGTLWFVYMLPIFFLVVRFTRSVPVLVMLAIGAALEIAPISTGYLLIDEFASRFVYFYAGYALANYAFALADKAAARPLWGVAGLAVWAVINTAAVFTEVQIMGETYSIAHLPVASLLLGGLGALAVVSFAAMVVQTFAGRLFSYAGARSIVIYLAFFLPMVIAREGAFRLGLIQDTGLLSTVTTVIAVFTPLLGYWIIQSIKPFGVFRFLFERPSWASIDRDAKPSRVGIAPAE